MNRDTDHINEFLLLERKKTGKFCLPQVLENGCSCTAQLYLIFKQETEQQKKVVEVLFYSADKVANH